MTIIHRLPGDWWQTATATQVEAVQAQVDKARERIEAEPRPDVMYVADVPADGSVEIRWWSNAANAWGTWARVTGEEDSGGLGRAWRYLVGPDISLHRDEVVQVRPVMDMQTGQTLGQVA